MITNETESRRASVEAVAREMMTAARTAPKARGTDLLEIVTVTGEGLAALAAEMRRISEERGLPGFARDAANVEQSQAVVVIATRRQNIGLDCGMCGFATCAEKDSAAPGAPCGFNLSDMGTAVGSAVSLAADRRVDNRIMYSIGIAAMRLGYAGECHAALGIALSCSGKSPYFDRRH